MPLFKKKTAKPESNFVVTHYTSTSNGEVISNYFSIRKLESPFGNIFTVNPKDLPELIAELQKHLPVSE
jgi:hypothetical protein